MYCTVSQAIIENRYPKSTSNIQREKKTGCIIISSHGELTQCYLRKCRPSVRDPSPAADKAGGTMQVCLKAMVGSNLQPSILSLPCSPFQIYVYSSEIGSWDEGGVLTTISPDFNVESGIYCNGDVHWYAPREASVYYDVDQQCLEDLPNLVSDTGSYVYVRYFEEFKGNLYLGLSKNDESLDFDVLELKEDYSGWFLRYHVDLTHIGKCVRPSFFVLYVACGENEEDPVIVLFCNWLKIVLYNPRDCTLRTMDEVDIKFYDIFAMGKIGRVLHPYFETLLNVGLEPYNG
ncbi:F-box protein [Sesbania bispinosa]|nr:F-box protein [Sesbania bispinosa]